MSALVWTPNDHSAVSGVAVAVPRRRAKAPGCSARRSGSVNHLPAWLRAPYDYTASANCFKARLTLARLGLSYERVPVDIFAGESSSADFRAKSPAGRTPVLELDTGEAIAESNAILLFLAEGTPLVPERLVDRARVWQWL